MSKDKDLIGIINNVDELYAKISTTLNSCNKIEQLNIARDFYSRVINKNLRGSYQNNALVILDFSYKQAFKKMHPVH